MGAVHHDFNLLWRPGVGPVRACKAFDAEHLAAYTFPAALAHLLGEVAAFIDKGHRHAQFYTILELEIAVEDQIVQLFPCSVIIGSPHHDAFFDAPCLVEVAVAFDFVLHTVILRVNAGSQYKHTIGQLGLVLLTAAQQRILVLYVAAVFP